MTISLRDKIFSRLEDLGISPKRSLGQNFLVSDLVVKKIIDAADPETFTQTFEVGPGLGALTDPLKEKAKNLTVIEMDQTFAQFWRDQEIEVFEGDALKFPWQDRVSDNTLLVSNLPYQISSRLVVDMSLIPIPPQRMVLMFQKEVAQRIMADEKSGDYGLLSVVAQSYWNVNTVLEAGAVDFHPKPKVASRVLRFDRKPSAVEDGEDFLRFLKTAFQNRRKKLLPKLKPFEVKTQLSEIFEDLSISPDVRVDQLSVPQLQSLYLQLKKEYE